MRTPPPATAVAAVSLVLGAYYTGHLQVRLGAKPLVEDESGRFSCRPFLPNLFADTPPTTSHSALGTVAETAETFFTDRFSKGDIDSLSIAVVTSNGVLFEKNCGVTRGNESATSPPTTSHSQYRIASVSKLFTALEGLILEEKGIISWDDPVDKYFKDYKYRLDGLDPQRPVEPREKAPMTLYQLVTHTSGLGRDWPPGTVTGWPESLFGGGPPPTNGHPFPSHQNLFDAIAKHHLTSPPASYPAYSNTGTGLLGIALATADSKAKGVSPAITYADLLQRDIFGPMGLNGSHFLTTNENKHLVVVPSLGPEVADQDFLDAMNPAGGQFSSLSDLITVTQTLLNPKHPKSQISQYSRDKWLQTVHAFEEDDWTEIGFIWEIIKQKDSNGRARKIYWKLGAMAGYHSAVAIHPGTGYGVVVLLGGHYPDAAKLAYDAFEIFQPSIDRALAELATDLYEGKWTDEDGAAEMASSARIVVDKGTLYVEDLTLQGTNALTKFGARGRLALRSSMRRDEFRLVLRTRSPLNHLRGPRNESLIFGHFNLLEADYPSLHTTWFEEYGSTMRTAGILSVPQLYTIDLRLVNHVLSHSMDYFRPPEGRKFLTEILGQGVLVTEGQQHKHQRHIMNPAFGPAQIRGFTGIFLEKASRLCDHWSHQIASRDGTLRTDVIIGISKMTLDVIGLAGFTYEFDALNTEKPPNELSVVFQEIFKSPPRMTVSEILKNVIPVLGRIRDNRAKKVAAARATMHRIGMQLLQERKAEIMRKYGETGGAVEKKDVQGRDLLTLLIKANMATDIPDDQRLTDEEVLAQVPTFLVAGNETTSTATAWCLYALCKHLNMQQRLREELLGVPTDAPTMEELNSLPYLDLIVHETLRLHCPITLTSRIAMRDDVLPLSEPLADARGNVLNELPILEGQRILIPILALHTSKRIWGEDASEFKPERWQNPPKTVSAIPGVWGNLLAFLGGAHACIGYRFSLIEMKAILFMLIRTFEFELSVPAEEVVPIGRFLQRPALHNHRGEGTQLPLLIRPYKRT